MHNDNPVRELIESELSQALELGLDAEEALAEAAGLLSEAESRYIRLARAMPSMPPPTR